MNAPGTASSVRRPFRIIGVTEDTRYLAGGRLAFLKMMDATCSPDFHVTIFCSEGATQAHFSPRRASCIRIKASHRRIIGPILFFVKLFFKMTPTVAGSDVVVVNSGYTVPLVLFTSKVLRKKVVVLQHDADTMTFLQKMASSRSRRLTAIVRWMMSYPPLLLVDGVLCISETTRNGLAKMGILPKTFVVGNVVDI
ncbi:MAG: glycosyltransferase [Thermoprotei archaeon]